MLRRRTADSGRNQSLTSREKSFSKSELGIGEKEPEVLKIDSFDEVTGNFKISFPFAKPSKPASVRIEDSVKDDSENEIMDALNGCKTEKEFDEDKAEVEETKQEVKEGVEEEEMSLDSDQSHKFLSLAQILE